MSYTRILVRRGTATEWTTANPILASGEFGYESNTGKFKVGNGSSNWSALKYFVNFDDIKTAIVDSAPGVLDTLNEIAQALGDDQNFAATILGEIADKAPLNSPTFTGTVDMSGATLSGVMLPINWMGTFSDLETYAENDLVVWNGNVFYATGPNLSNSEGYYPTAPGADWELFASKGDTGPTGPTGPQGEQGASGLQYASVDVVSASRAVVSSDAGKLLTANSSSEIVMTVNATTSFQVGQHFTVSRSGTGAVRFVGSGVTIASSLGRLSISDQYSVASLICIGTNSYLLIGDLSA